MLALGTEGLAMEVSLVLTADPQGTLEMTQAGECMLGHKQESGRAPLGESRLRRDAKGARERLEVTRCRGPEAQVREVWGSWGRAAVLHSRPGLAASRSQWVEGGTAGTYVPGHTVTQVQDL